MCPTRADEGLGESDDEYILGSQTDLRGSERTSGLSNVDQVSGPDRDT
jgi:hypothetical protein